MLWIASGTTDQFLPFNAGDLGLSFTSVYRSRNGATPVAMDTPTISELDAANMPAEYTLLMDEDMVIDAGNITESMVFWIRPASAPPIRKEIVLFDPEVLGPDGGPLKAGGGVVATVNDTTVTPTTTVFQLSGPTIGKLMNRKTILFQSGTAELVEQRGDISSAVWNVTDSRWDVTLKAALSTAPADGDAVLVI